MNSCVIFLAVLFVGGCNAGVVGRHFNLDNDLSSTESDNGSSENTSQASKIEISNTTLPVAEQSNFSLPLNFTVESEVSSEIKTNDLPPNLTDVDDNFTQELNLLNGTSEKPAEEFDIFNNELKSTESVINGSELISDKSHLESSQTNQKNLNVGESSETNSNEIDVPTNIPLDNLRNEENVSRLALDIDASSEQNETNHLDEIFMHHKDLLNGTDTDAFNQSTSFLNKANSSVIAFEKQMENFKNELEPTSEISGSEGITKRGSTEETDGIFSGIGLDFIINSEVARNAAKAMEIFNFTDSLTDHIIEENEFHTFLTAELPTAFDEQDLNSTLQSPTSQITSELGTFFNGSNEFPEEIKNSMIGGNSNASEISEDENLVNLTVFKAPDISSNSTLNLTDLWIERNETREQFDGIENKTINSEEWNRTLNLSTWGNTSTVDEITTSLDANLNNSVSNSDGDDNNRPKCPPPGFCILWLWSQDTCAVNSHCLGSRICCRVGCSKTCIEV